MPEILALIRELAVYEKLLHEVEATEEQLHATLFGDTPQAHVTMAVYRDQVAGMALWFYNYSTFLAKPGIFLEDLFVRPDFRRLGIGRALLHHLAARCVAEGCGRFEWHVLDWNAPAIAFYEELGARMMADWRCFRLDGEALAAFGQGALPVRDTDVL